MAEHAFHITTLRRAAGRNMLPGGPDDRGVFRLLLDQARVDAKRTGER